VIALVVTLLVALYILGPDLVARWLLGFVVQRKNLLETKSEEITRGIMWAILPLWAAWALRHVGPFALPPSSKFDLQTFFSGIYSESYFKDHQSAFFAAAGSFIRLNACILVRLYAIVFLCSLIFNSLIGRYGRIRARLTSQKKKSRLLAVLTTIILPRISQWHIILSDILLPSKKMNIAVDALTKDGTLYQGILENKMIAPDGSLQTLTLTEPKRFRREPFLKDRENSPDLKPDSYWKPIPGNLFVIMASDITTLNVKHVPATVAPYISRYGRDQEMIELLKTVRDKVDAIANYTQERPPETKNR
jgi:hypothetical protein